jgi:stage V sporulation protein D (sporulation-specific penicillin-binding protein)
MDDPEYIVLVALDTPSRSTGIYISGGVMAAPTVGAVMEDILPYLEVQRNYGPEDAAGRQVVVEDFTGLTLAEAQKQLKALGLTAQCVGTGEQVTAQIPAAGNTVPGNGQVLLYLGQPPDIREVTVPDFTGMTRQQASDAAGKLGLYILVAGNDAMDAHVIGQSEPKDTKVPVGTMIRLEFADIKAAD